MKWKGQSLELKSLRDKHLSKKIVTQLNVKINFKKQSSYKEQMDSDVKVENCIPK
jgi:hypothetical protein